MAVVTPGAATGARSPSPRVLRALAVIAAVATTAAAVFAVAWLGGRSRPGLDIDRLDARERQQLIETMADVSGAAYSSAWFAPEIGYTLRRGAEVEAWGDRFTSNELGFRSGPAAKVEGVFRVVFVGDSWTYGMGVPWRDSFPKQVEEVARAANPSGPPVEAWTLALPGWNTLNQAAALELLYDRLQPDAVVLCPVVNDASSLPYVLANGLTREAVVYRDAFGSDHPLRYPIQPVDSWRYRQRWRAAATRIGELGDWLATRAIPFHLMFVAQWDEPYVHALVADSGLSGPYLIAPRALAEGVWRGPAPWYHGTPAAYRVLAHMAYDALARGLGWPASGDRPPGPRELLFAAPPPPEAWRDHLTEVMRASTDTLLATTWRTGLADDPMVVGPLAAATGEMARATTILVRRAEGSRRLGVELARIEAATALYPLTVTITIPSPAGGTRSAATVPAVGPEPVVVLVPLPDDIAVGSALDVELRAERVTFHAKVLKQRSVRVLAIDQE